MLVAFWAVGVLAGAMLRAVLWVLGFLWGAFERLVLSRGDEESPEDRTVVEPAESDITLGSRLAA